MQNNRSAGTTGLTCDALLPVGGQDENGVYKRITVTNSGGLFAGQPESSSLVPYLYSPTQAPITASLKAGGLLLANLNVHPLLTVTAGQYVINPQFICPISTASGTSNINFILYKTTSTFATYIGTLLLGTGTVNPLITNCADGIVGFWQGITMYSLGTGNTQISYNVNTAKSVFLPVGIYSLAVVVQSAFTTSDVAAYVGFNEFNRLG